MEKLAQDAVSIIDALANSSEHIDPACVAKIERATKKLRVKVQVVDILRAQSSVRVVSAEEQHAEAAEPVAVPEDVYSTAPRPEAQKSDEEVLLPNKRSSTMGRSNKSAWEDPTSDIRVALTYCGALLVFLLAAAGVFYWLEYENGWSFIDAWYFVIVTINTVGYGVLTPSSDLCRMIVVAFIVFGMAFSVFALSILTELMLKKVTEASENTGAHSYTPFGPKVLAMSILLLAMIVAGVLYGILWEKWNFVQSLYFTIVTVSTVGYGDFAPATDAARLSISFYTLFAGGTFASILSYTIASYVDIRKKASAAKFLCSQLSPELLQQMPKDENGNVGRAEFISFMLEKMGYVDSQVMQMVNECFYAFDADGSGVLTMDDLVSDEEGLQYIKYFMQRYGIQEDDASAMPIGGLFGLQRSLNDHPSPETSHEAHIAALKETRQIARDETLRKEREEYPELFCASCDNRYAMDAEFCRKCGAKRREATGSNDSRAPGKEAL